MRLPHSFLHQVLRPGRYLGGELGVAHLNWSERAASHVWFYPGPYERALADFAWRRGFFQLNETGNSRCARAVDFAADAWAMFETGQVAPFAIDGHGSLREAASVVFWAPDVFDAARIPSILARLKLNPDATTIGVVVSGWAAPRFLRGHVDWVLPAPSGWLPAAIIDLLLHGQPPQANACYTRARDNWDQVFSGEIQSVPLLACHPAVTPQWIPRVDAGARLSDIEMLEVDDTGALTARSAPALVADAQTSLRKTGLDGLRFCEPGFDCGQTIAATMIELSRVFNTKRIELEIPALTPADYANHWQAYRPHLIKPVLRLRLQAGDDPANLIDLGHRALNDGWHALTLVLAFDSSLQYEALLPLAHKVIEGWSSLASSFSDKRPLRLEFKPAPIGRWLDAPSGPSENDFRRLVHSCRLEQEAVSGLCFVEHFRIGDVIARNWLAATDHDVWPNLAALNLLDSNEESVAPFDWTGWIRNRSGLNRPPETGLSRRTGAPIPPAIPAGETSTLLGTASVAFPERDSALYGRRKRRPGFTRRLSSPNRTRLRVGWGKTADWRYCSHLDMVRTIERAIRISGLPAAYSEGFHPRLKLSFGPPLAFGLTSRAEFFDLILDRGVEAADADALREALPDGVFMSRAESMPAQMPSLAETLNEAVYSAVVPLEPAAAQEAIQQTLSQPRIDWTRADRPSRPPVDPRNSLKTTEIEITPAGVVWSIRLSLGGSGNIRPADWASLLFGFNAEETAGLIIERTELVVRQGDHARSPFDFP